MSQGCSRPARVTDLPQLPTLHLPQLSKPPSHRARSPAFTCRGFRTADYFSCSLLTTRTITRRVLCPAYISLEKHNKPLLHAIMAGLLQWPCISMSWTDMAEAGVFFLKRGPCLYRSTVHRQPPSGLVKLYRTAALNIAAFQRLRSGRRAIVIIDRIPVQSPSAPKTTSRASVQLVNHLLLLIIQLIYIYSCCFYTTGLFGPSKRGEYVQST